MFEFLLDILNHFVDHFKSSIQSGNHLWLTALEVLIWQQGESGSVYLVDIDRQVIELCV